MASRKFCILKTNLAYMVSMVSCYLYVIHQVHYIEVVNLHTWTEKPREFPEPQDM